jgi:hypothetical protein
MPKPRPTPPPSDSPPRVVLTVNELIGMLTGAFVVGLLTCYMVYAWL